MKIGCRLCTAMPKKSKWDLFLKSFWIRLFCVTLNEFNRKCSAPSFLFLFQVIFIPSCKILIKSHILVPSFTRSKKFITAFSWRKTSKDTKNVGIMKRTVITACCWKVKGQLLLYIYFLQSKWVCNTYFIRHVGKILKSWMHFNKTLRK